MMTDCQTGGDGLQMKTRLWRLRGLLIREEELRPKVDDQENQEELEEVTLLFLWGWCHEEGVGGRPEDRPEARGTEPKD